MKPVLLFAAIALLCLVLLLLFTPLSTAAAVLCCIGVFVLLQLLCLVFFWAVSLTVPYQSPLKKQNRICRYGIGAISSVINFYCGVHPVLTGMEKLPKEGRFVFVCNHRSAFDPLLVMDRLRDFNIAFISKPSNLRIPFVGRLANAYGYLALDRENDRNALKTILTAVDYLKRDVCSIGIYPEGTRSKTGELLPFHAGSFKVAQKAKVPIVVASVRGSENVRRAKLFSGTRIYLNIIEVIPAETVCALRTNELSEQVRESIRKDLAFAEEG